MRTIRKIPLRLHFSTLREKHKEFLQLAKNEGEGEIKLSRKPNCLELKISNPQKRNALSGRMMNQFVDCLEAIERDIQTDNSLVALSIIGEGEESFCAGADLAFAQNVLNTPEKGYLMGSFMADVLNTIRQTPLITVCCLNGPALGGGAEMATVGDFRIISEKAFLQFVHAKIGASPGWGGATRLYSIVGRSKALHLLGTSEKVTATKALDWGIADKIVNPAEESWDNHIASFLQPYCAQPYPKSVRAMKTIVSACDKHLSSERNSVEAELQVFKSRWYSEDNIEAVAKAIAGLKAKQKR